MVKKVDHSAMIASFFGTSGGGGLKDTTAHGGTNNASTATSTSLFRNILVSVDAADENNAPQLQ